MSTLSRHVRSAANALREPLSGLRLGLLSAAISAAVFATGTAASPTSFPQPVPNASGASTQGMDARLDPAALPEVTVSITGAGAVYVSRDHDMLHFWVVNEVDGTVERKPSQAIDGTAVETIAIELDAHATGLFFADNLFEPGDAFRLSFRGTVDHGNIAMPIAAAVFEPLWAITDEDVIVTVLPDQTELTALLNTQKAIYQRVTDVASLHSEHVDLFRVEMQEELTRLFELSGDEAAAGQTLIDNATASASSLHGQFVEQANVDAMRLETAGATLEQFALEQGASLERGTPACVEDARTRLDGEMSALTAMIDASPDDEVLDERIEAAIADAEARISRHEASIAACVDTRALETLSLDTGIDEEGSTYLQMNAQGQSLEANTVAAVEPWSQSVEQRGLEQGERIENTSLPLSMMAYQDYFSEWLSPAYADEGDASAAEADTPASSADPKRLADAVNAKGQEKLCDDETWNIEFSFVGFSVVFATPWDDRVTTGNDNNLIFTFRGNDCIESHAGYDAVFAGPGRDLIFGGDDHDFLFGGRDDDQIHGSAGNTYTVVAGVVTLAFDIGNLILGQAGHDRLFGGEVAADRGEDGTVDNHGYADLILGDSLLFGGAAGNDTIVGEMGVDFLFGQAGNDMLSNLTPGVITVDGLPVPFGTFFFGNTGNDQMFGSNTTIAGTFPLLGDFMFGNDGDDLAQANAGTDFVFGNEGNDTLDGGRNTDFVFGNRGQDTVIGNDGSDLVSGDTGDDTVLGSPGLFDLVLGGQGNDRLFGNEGFDLIFGSDDNDVIQGNADFDLIFGGPGSDFINGNDGLDFISGGAGEDQIGGDDGIDLLLGNRDSDTINGGDGFDVILGNENSQKPETLSGNNGLDLVFGNDGADRIFGNDGVDLLLGNAGNDEIDGNNGLDIIIGGDADDILRGNDGVDVMTGSDGNDDLSGGNDADLLLGNNGCDFLAGNPGVDLLIGGDGKDRLWGGDGIDLLLGNAGQDLLRGEASSDVLMGGDDHDSLGGDDGIDVLMGGSDNDFMLGGNNADVMLGADGNDFARGDNGNDLILGGNSDDTLDGGGDGDLLLGGDGNDNINSGNGTDISFGNSGNDRLRAVEGSNYAFGNSGNDTVDGYFSGGFDSRDWLFGNTDNDTITGNKTNQKDMRLGGLGSDSEHWNTTYVGIGLFNGSWSGNSNCN